MMEFPLQLPIREDVIQYWPIHYNSRDKTNPQVLLGALTQQSFTCYRGAGGEGGEEEKKGNASFSSWSCTGIRM